jgi:glycosyltransferase involved in cell wall biosynthesis
VRILQVVPYLSSDGAFGGPVSVAVEQTAALAGLGHRVALLAGWDGRVRPAVDGVALRLVRAVRGRLPLSAVLAPGVPLAILAARRHVDVVHLHAGRDLVSLTAMLALRGHRRVVLQPHGMVMPDERPLARLVDALIVRPAMRRAVAVLALTDDEERGLHRVAGGGARVERIRNGIRVGRPELDRATDAPVLFLARLHPRKQAPVFVAAAAEVLAAGIDRRFEVAGPDEGDLGRVEDAIAASGRPDRIRLTGAVEPAEAGRRLAAAAVYVLPSTGEVFPMTVLESLAAGTPVVLSDDCGLAPELAADGAAVVVPPTPSAVARAVSGLLTDEPARRALAARGVAVVRQRYGIAAVARRLETLYSGAGAS